MTIRYFAPTSFLISIVLYVLAMSPGTPHETVHPDVIKQDSSEQGIVDHHTHIFGPDVRQYLVSRIDRLDSLPPLGIEKLNKTVENNAVQKAAILSNAYFFSDSGNTSASERDSVQSENDRVAEAVAKYPDKFVGFLSVNPLSNTAIAEMERNAPREEFVGLKLHLANSRVDLRNENHVEKLAEIFKKANDLNLGIVIHMRTQPQPYGRKDAEIFIDNVLSKAPDIPVQIAHVAGWGGYDEATDEVLGVFAERISTNNLDKNVYFDISAVVKPASGKQNSTNSDWDPQKRYDRLVTNLRKIGMDRILFGTDWPDWSPDDYKADLKNQLPLTQEELNTILSNWAPWFK